MYSSTKTLIKSGVFLLAITTASLGYAAPRLSVSAFGDKGVRVAENWVLSTLEIPSGEKISFLDSESNIHEAEVITTYNLLNEFKKGIKIPALRIYRQ